MQLGRLENISTKHMGLIWIIVIVCICIYMGVVIYLLYKSSHKVDRDEQLPVYKIPPKVDHDGQLPVYVISLPESIERRQRLTKHIHNIPFSFVEATNGERLSKEEEDLKTRYINKDAALNPGQIGCFLSHLQLWQKLWKENTESALILEDDAIFAQSFSNILHVVESIHENDIAPDIIFLGHCFEEECGSVIINEPYFRVVPSIHPLCTHGYVIYRSGIKKLLRCLSSRLSTGPIDGEIVQCILKTDLYALSLHPTLINQDKEQPSTIIH